MTKYLGLVSFFILVAGLLFTVLRWKGGLHMTFSQHVARARSSTIYYSVLFAVSLPLLYLFFANWFVPEFKLTGWFTVLVAISVVAQFLCTLVPEVGGWKTTVHRLLTGVSVAMLLPIMYVLAGAPTIPSSGKYLAALCLAGMVGILGFAIFHKNHKFTLLLQAGYYLLFFLPVLYVAYF